MASSLAPARIGNLGQIGQQVPSGNGFHGNTSLQMRLLKPLLLYASQAIWIGAMPWDRKQLTLQPQEAYDTVQPRLIRQMPRRRFPKHLVLRVENV